MPSAVPAPAEPVVTAPLPSTPVEPIATPPSSSAPAFRLHDDIDETEETIAKSRLLSPKRRHRTKSKSKSAPGPFQKAAKAREESIQAKLGGIRAPVFYPAEKVC